MDVEEAGEGVTVCVYQFGESECVIEEVMEVGRHGHYDVSGEWREPGDSVEDCWTLPQRATTVGRLGRNSKRGARLGFDGVPRIIRYAYAKEAKVENIPMCHPFFGMLSFARFLLG